MRWVTEDQLFKHKERNSGNWKKETNLKILEKKTAQELTAIWI